MMENIIEAIASNVPSETQGGDYIESGLIHCGTCHTPKQCRITHPFKHEEVVVPCICKCESDRIKSHEDRLRNEDRQRRIDRTRRRCFGNAGYWRDTFADDDGREPDLAKKARNYASHFATFKERGQGLLLFGDTGTGKSFHSACIANALLEDGYNVVMASVPELVARLQNNQFKNGEYFDILTGCDLLILDDLGAERGTEYAREQVYAIVDGRYKARIPMLVSTNLTRSQLQNPPDIDAARVYGRLLERCRPIEYKGRNRRKMLNDYASMDAILDG